MPHDCRTHRPDQEAHRPGRKRQRERGIRALAKVQDLLERHNLSREDVEGIATADDEPIGIDQGEAVYTGARVRTWKKVLANVLAKYTGVYAFTHRKGGVATLRIVGRRTNAEVFRIMYRFAERELLRLSLKACKGRGASYANSWFLGAVHGIREALGQQRTRTIQERGLVSLDKAYVEAQAWAKAEVAGLRKSTFHFRKNAEAYLSGQAQGRKVKFHSGEVSKTRSTLGCAG